MAKLSLTQRKVLLLTQLSSSSMQDIAREVGVTLEAAERELQTANSRFAQLRNVSSSSTRGHLQALGERVGDARFPRPTIIRRAGTARRAPPDHLLVALGVNGPKRLGTTAFEVVIAHPLGDVGWIVRA